MPFSPHQRIHDNHMTSKAILTFITWCFPDSCIIKLLFFSSPTLFFGSKSQSLAHPQAGEGKIKLYLMEEDIAT